MDDEDELLIEETRRVAVRPFGQSSGELNLLERLLTLGVAWVGRLLPKNVCELHLSLPQGADAIRENATLIFSNYGSLVDNTTENATHRVRGMVQYGFKGWGRGLVTVSVRTAFGECSDVFVRGVSKEGLIKFYYGEKCAHLVADALRQPTPDARG